jgi:branched-chain amino acid transport system permease protein
VTESVAGADTDGRVTLKEEAAPWRPTKWGTISFLVLLSVIAPWVIVKLSSGNFYLHLIITFFYYSVIAPCWKLIMGVSGIYSFAQIALFAVGGWTTGVLASQYGWNPWFSIWLAPVAAVVAALIIGVPTLRLRGVYVVLLTLGFHELLRNYTTNGPRIISGGGYGLKFVPRFHFSSSLPGDNILIWYFYVGLVMFGVTTYVIWRVFHSPLGLAFTALRDSESYAVSRGIDQFRIRLLLFGLSAFFTGFAGAFATHYLGSISTQVFAFALLIRVLAMIVIGGWGSFGGPIFGAALLIGLDEWLRGLGDYRVLAIGLALALIAVLAPQGLLPLLRDRISRFFGPEESATGARVRTEAVLPSLEADARPPLEVVGAASPYPPPDPDPPDHEEGPPPEEGPGDPGS